MNDTATTALIGTGGVGLFIAFLRWAVTLWATIRREELEAAKVSAASQRADSARMTDALLAQATSNAVLGGKIETSNAMLAGKLDQLATRLDRITDLRERTPGDPFPVAVDPPSERSVRRARGSPDTGRTNKPPHDD